MSKKNLNVQYVIRRLQSKGRPLFEVAKLIPQPLTKDTARLRTSKTKTPIAAGDRLMMVGTDEIYRLDSWQFFSSDIVKLYVVRGRNKIEASVRDFGLEVYADAKLDGKYQITYAEPQTGGAGFYMCNCPNSRSGAHIDDKHGRMVADWRERGEPKKGYYDSAGTYHS